MYTFESSFEFLKRVGVTCRDSHQEKLMNMQIWKTLQYRLLFRVGTYLFSLDLYEG